MPTVSKSTLRLGNQGEEYVAQWLTRQGYTILERNYRKRTGEIDIIVQQNECIAFVEVKSRTHEYFPLSQVINPSKQQKIIITAQQYCIEHKIMDMVLRFDVALTICQNQNYDMTYIPNAFAGGEFF